MTAQLAHALTDHRTAEAAVVAFRRPGSASRRSLDIARVPAARSRQDVDLAQVLVEAARPAWLIAEHRDVTLVCFSSSPALARCDRQDLASLLEALATAAVSLAPTGCIVVAGVASEGAEVAVRVTCSGRGLPAAALTNRLDAVAGNEHPRPELMLKRSGRCAEVLLRLPSAR